MTWDSPDAARPKELFIESEATIPGLRRQIHTPRRPASDSATRL